MRPCLEMFRTLYEEDAPFAVRDVQSAIHGAISQHPLSDVAYAPSLGDVEGPIDEALCDALLERSDA